MMFTPSALTRWTCKGRPVRGNPDAKVTIVNYDDYECPFCSRLHTTLIQDILPQYGDKIKIVYKDYPLPMHPWAQARGQRCQLPGEGEPRQLLGVRRLCSRQPASDFR